MKRVFTVVAVLAALTALMSACSGPSVLPSSTLVGVTPTPAPTAVPTAAPVSASASSGFDTGAGNCVDAANRAIDLIGQAASGDFGGTSFTTDMRLYLEPHGPNSGCANPLSRIGRYRGYVSSAHLTVWPLDTTWINAGPDTRSVWLADVLAALVHLYPHADISISVIDITTGSLCGTATIGPGAGGARQIDPTCL